MLLCRTVPTGCGLDWRRLLAETPQLLLEEWRMLYDLEPWGEPWQGQRDDLRTGILCMVNEICHGRQPREPLAYIPGANREERPPQTEAELREVCAAIAKAADEMSK
jgi:hypothetical protein